MYFICYSFCIFKYKVVYYMNEMSVINLHITLTKQTHWLESVTKSSKLYVTTKKIIIYPINYSTQGLQMRMRTRE